MKALCATLPDRRTGENTVYAMADIGMAAFSTFFMQSPSFLAHQTALERGRGTSNCRTLFAMDRIPTDNHIRSMLDAAPPESLLPMFDETLAALEAGGGLGALQRLGGHVLIALDGTEYFCSQKLSCCNCSSRARANGRTEHFHAMVSAAMVAPGHERALPLEPEFIAPQDGAEKQDCEARAMHRWLAKHGAKYARLKPIYLGDDLSSRQPTCEAVLAAGGHFLFTAKPSSHKTLYSWLDGAEVPMLQLKVKQGARFVTHRYRWLESVPLRDGKDAMLVNWLQIEIVDPAGKTTYRNGFVTDLAVTAGNVAELAACGRALEDRERELQHAQDQGLQPGAQFRPRPEASGGGARHHEPPGLRHAHGGRTRRPGVEGRARRRRRPQAVLRGPARHHHLPGVPDLGLTRRHLACRPASACRPPPLTPASIPPPPAIQPGHRPTIKKVTMRIAVGAR